MNVMNHPNYYQLLLERGAHVVSPLKMKGGAERSNGRMWEAKAVLRLFGYEIHLSTIFHGHNTETEEVAAANLNVEKIKMSVEGGSEADFVMLTRVKHFLVMLNDGIYANADAGEISEKIRSIITYNTTKYAGIPSLEEIGLLRDLGYVRIIGW